jgi:hypothetical protein
MELLRARQIVIEEEVLVAPREMHHKQGDAERHREGNEQRKHAGILESAARAPGPGG